MSLKSVLFSIACLGVSASAAAAAPVQWTSGPSANGHWYELVSTFPSGITWGEAKTAAEASTHMGMSGYLVSITSAAEQAFLNLFVNPLNFNAFIGLNDIASEGTHTWAGGPEDGQAATYTNWSLFEPNNIGNEDVTLGWWVGNKWNDVSTSYKAFKYVVEYGPETPSVPVPASLPLAATALALTGFIARRRRAAA